MAQCSSLDMHRLAFPGDGNVAKFWNLKMISTFVANIHIACNCKSQQQSQRYIVCVRPWVEGMPAGLKL